MKYIFLLFCFCIITSCASRINLSYTTKSSNVFYPYIENIVEVSSNSKQPIKVEINNGGEIITPVKRGENLYGVTIKKKENPSFLILTQGKTTDKIRLRIHEIPSPHIRFDWIQGSSMETREMTAEQFSKIQKISIAFPDFQHDSRYEIMPFDIVLISADDKVRRYKSEENGRFFKIGTKSGDKVIFAGIGIKIINTGDIIEVKDFVLTIL